MTFTLQDARELPADALRQLVEEAGWHAVVRSESLCAVSLETPTPATALLSTRDGVLHVLVEAASLESADPTCIDGVIALLESVSSSVRLVQSSFTAGSAWLEVAAPLPADATWLADALGALSVAWRMAGREAALLASHADLAAAYLTLRSHTGPQLQNQKQKPKHK